ncbi:MAG: hypothetical protein IT377_12070 [Polyangiaceae bacterium]|nr:hypothetical protein [Polyangiaceae bacterium]
MNARFGIVVMSAILLCACSGAGDRPAPPSGSDDQTEAPPPDDDPDPVDAPNATECETGATHKCKVQLPTHGSIETCYVGVNLCVDGVWSECGDEDALVKKYLGE